MALAPAGQVHIADVDVLVRHDVTCCREGPAYLSVLIGAAGTGKTSLLSALIAIDDVAKGGVLLLAPTGKAGVQMQRRAVKAKALTT